MYLLNKSELSKQTKLMIHRSILIPTIMFEGELWSNPNNLIQEFEVADTEVLKMIAGVSRIDQ